MLGWHLSIILPNHKSDFLFYVMKQENAPKTISVKVTKRKSKVRQDWHAPIKIYVCL